MGSILCSDRPHTTRPILPCVQIGHSGNDLSNVEAADFARTCDTLALCEIDAGSAMESVASSRETFTKDIESERSPFFHVVYQTRLYIILLTSKFGEYLSARCSRKSCLLTRPCPKKTRLEETVIRAMPWSRYTQTKPVLRAWRHAPRRPRSNLWRGDPGVDNYITFWRCMASSWSS